MKKDSGKRNLCYRARTKTGLSQEMFGQLLGKSQERISRWETGEGFSPYLKELFLTISRKCGKKAPKLLPWLIGEGRLAEALILVLGGNLDGPLGELVQTAERTPSSAGANHTSEDGSTPGPAS